MPTLRHGLAVTPKVQKQFGMLTPKQAIKKSHYETEVRTIYLSLSLSERKAKLLVCKPSLPVISNNKDLTIRYNEGTDVAAVPTSGLRRPNQSFRLPMPTWLLSW